MLCDDIITWAAIERCEIDLHNGALVCLEETCSVGTTR